MSQLPLDMVEMTIIFQGKVQGVGFRATSMILAKKLGIKGTVRNLTDGSVELIAQGTADHLNQLLVTLKEKAFVGTTYRVVKQTPFFEKIYSDFSIVS